MKQICRLKRIDAVKAIEKTKKVQYKHGIWNPYEVKDTEYAKDAIMRSGYGADVYVDSHGEYYVSIPCDSDMW